MDSLITLTATYGCFWGRYLMFFTLQSQAFALFALFGSVLNQIRTLPFIR